MERQNLTFLLPADVRRLTDDELFSVCQANETLRIEREPDGTVIVMPPAALDASERNTDIVAKLKVWNWGAGLGRVTGPDGGYILPSNAMRAPDAAWVSHARWDAVPAERRHKFLPPCPEFVVELRSPSDRLRPLQAKMDEWIASGCRLGWLIDPQEEQAFVYRHGAPTEHVASFDAVLSGEPVLPSFTFALGLLRR